MTTGERIKAVREQAGMDQEDVARAAAITVATLREIEQDRRTPRPATIRKIAVALRVQAEDLAE